MSKILDFIGHDGQTVVRVPFADEIKFDGHIATLPQPRAEHTEAILHQGITLLNSNQGVDVQINGQRVTYLFQ